MAAEADRSRESGGLLARALTELHLAGGEASRADLTRALAVGRSVMGYLLGELASEGLVELEAGSRAASEAGGRPSQRVRVAAGAPTVIAADLGTDAITVATVGLGGNVLRRRRRALPARISVEAGVGRLARQIAEQVDGAAPVAAVTVAVPSPVRRDDGRALAPLHLHWPPVPLRELLRERLDGDERTAGIEVRVANDSNLAALAESRRGAGRGASTTVYLGGATVGIGGGLTIGGNLFEGSRGYAIEPGHITVNPAGKPCTCGSTGCLEVEADSRALLRAYGRADVPELELKAAVDELLDAAAAGEAAAIAAIEHANEPLGIGLAGLINLTDPDCVVLGSTLGRRFELAPEPVRRGIAARSYIDSRGEVPLRPGVLADATLVGAAELAFQPLLDDPRTRA